MQKRILTAWLFVWLGMLPSLARVYLVSVGIADYPGVKNDLRSCVNDAKTIAKIFRATKDATIYSLHDKEATQDAVLNTMQTAFSMAGEDDTVILYFSGHGYNKPGSLVCYDEMLTYQRIFDVLKSCRATKKIIFADACFSGKMRTNKRQSNRYQQQNVMFFLSSRTKETSLEMGYENGVFTMFLERGLRGGADLNHDKVITARELYNFAHKGVIEFTEGKQHPVMWGKFDDNMTVIKW